MYDRYVYTGSADASIRKWDIATCECDFVYTGHQSKIHKCVVDIIVLYQFKHSHNYYHRLLVTEDFIFSTSHDKTARIWYNDVTEHQTKPCIRVFKVSGQTNRAPGGEREKETNPLGICREWRYASRVERKVFDEAIFHLMFIVIRGQCFQEKI